MITYKTTGVCSRKIVFDIEDNKLYNVIFEGGCQGNLAAISKLVEGRNINEIIALLEGNTCGLKSTSCADQLVKAIKEAIK